MKTPPLIAAASCGGRWPQAIISSPRQVAMVTDVDHARGREELVALMAHVNIVLAEDVIPW